MYWGDTDRRIGKIFGCFVVALLVFCFVTAVSARAADYYVDFNNGTDSSGYGGSSGSGAWKTLHYAISQMPAGGTLHVADGTYIYNAGGENDSTLSILAGSTIVGDGPGVVLDGGAASSSYSAITISQSGVVIKNLTIRNFSGAAGIEIQDASPQIEANTFYNNLNGISIDAVSSAASPLIENNLIYACDYGINAVLDIAGANPEIYHNTIDGTSSGTAGIYIYSNAAISPVVSYNIMSNFGGSTASGIWVIGSSTPVISYNDVWNNTTNYSGVTDPTGSNGNISADPSYQSRADFDYYLNFDSPCNDAIPLSANDPVGTDIQGNGRPLWGSSKSEIGSDIGAYEFGMDVDQDGMDDNWEVDYFGSITVSDGSQDHDGDTLTDLQEYRLRTNPILSDTDNDGLSDGEEVKTDLTSPTNPDTDNDGMPDGWEVHHGLNPLVNDANSDKDSDGYSNLQEFLDGTDPTNATDYAALAGNYFVDPQNGDDTYSGRSWTYAKRTLQAAIGSIDPKDGPPPYYIDIKQGTCNESIQLPNGVHLRGGYSPALTGVDLSVRDSATYPTTIDAGGMPYVISAPFIDLNTGPRTIYGSSPDDVYVACDDGKIFHHTQGDEMAGSLAYTDPDGNALNASWGWGAANVFFVGDYGTIIHYSYNGTNGTWNRVTGVSSGNLNGIWGPMPDDIFAVGNSGTILHYDGNSWSPMTSPTTENLNAIGGNPQVGIYLAVGDAGTMLYYTVSSGSWNSLTTTYPSIFPQGFPTASLRSIWGSSPSDIFVVGDNSTIFHYNGSTWLPMSPPAGAPTVTLRSVWGTGPDDVYAVGDSGTILHYDGSGWSKQNTPVSWNIYSIAGDDKTMAEGGSGEIVAVGGTELNPLFHAYNPATETYSWELAFPATRNTGIDGLTLTGMTYSANVNSMALDFFRSADNVVITNNTVTGNDVGTISLGGPNATSVVIRNNTITGNTYTNGIFFGGDASAVVIDGNTIDGTSTGADTPWGNGILFSPETSATANTVVISNNTIRNAGGTYSGIGLYPLLVDTTINNNTIQNLSAPPESSSNLGIGIFNSNIGLTISGNVLNDISGTGEDGIILFGEATSSGAVIKDNRISHLVTSSGGGISFWQSNDTENPAMVANNLITGSTIGINSSASAVQYVFNTLYGNGTGINESGSNTFQDNIVANSGSAGFVVNSGTPMLAYNDVYGSVETNYSGITDPTGSNGNISADPMFADPANGAFSLQVGSPCIDSGTDAGISVDIDGTPRPVGSGYDMGCYEFHHTVSFSNAGPGNISGSLIQYVADGGNTTAVTATPSGTGYQFVNWTDQTGAVVGSDATLTVNNVTQNETITANFAYSLTIIQTSDLHDHASGYGPFHDYTPLDTTDNDSVRGGYARLAAEINTIRQENGDVNTLLVDSGDYFMGTVYDMTASNPVALAFFKAMNYDAVTLGNHEFDWGPDGLAMLLGNGVTNGFDVPIVESNMDASANANLTALVNNNVIRNKLILTTANGLKIGILGLQGENSIQDMPAAAPVTFINPDDPDNYPAIQAMVDDLRNNDHVDLVVVLSHGGIHTDGTGDDATLAENVSGINIIASGHYHTATPAPFVIGPSDTLIFSPGAYGEWLSHLDISYSKAENKVIGYTFDLIPIDDTIAGDSAVQTMVQSYNGQLDLALASIVPGGIGSTVSSTAFNLEETDFSESSLGDISADAVRFAANQIAQASGGTPYDIGVVPSGVIRDGLYVGKTGAVTFSDAYNVLPLGISPMDPSIPGYPLMSIYVTGAELRNACEISASISHMLGSDYYLNFSGLRYKLDPDAAPGAMVKQVYVTSPDDIQTTAPASPGTLIDLTDSSRLYHVAVDYYVLEMMYVLDTNPSFASLQIVPKDASGNPIAAGDLLNHRIDIDPTTQGIQELKEWQAFMQYLKGYIATAHSGQIPATVYNTDGTGRGRESILTYQTATFTTGNGGSVTGNTDQTVPINADATSVTATPAAGYHFVNWTGTEGFVSTDNPLILTGVTTNMTITANFAPNSANQPPDTPTLISPINNVVLPLGPVELKSGPYSDPEGDAHISSRWQVRPYDEADNWIIDETSESDLTSYTVTTGLEAGQRYAWRVGYEDAGSEQIRWSPEATFLIGEAVVDKSVPPVVPGITVANYKMVSFVQWPKKPNAGSVFGPLMNKAYDKNYMVGTYDPTLNGIGGYKEFPNFDVAPGHAYWFLARYGMDFSIDGVPVSKSADIYVSLLYNTSNANGWNMIACPNKAMYHWGDIEVVERNPDGSIAYGPMPIRQLPADNAYIDTRIWKWENGKYSASSSMDFTLVPYSGYWIKVKNANVSLVFPYDMIVSDASQNRGAAGWYARAKAWIAHTILRSDTAFAGAGDDSPPMPMTSLDGKMSDGTGSSRGCFISTAADSGN